MGLLDDAIREHLELKRRRGADPEEVAREQREALEPTAPSSTATTSGEGSGDGAPREASGALTARVAEPEETAELDMSSVLADAADHPNTAPQSTASEADALEWEMPAATVPGEGEMAEPDEDVLEETPDFLSETPEQERLWFEQRPPRDFDFDK
jgi:hypothetical protein